MTDNYKNNTEKRKTYFAEVILPLPVANLFTYRIPLKYNASVQAGCRVVVPFGKNRTLTAIIDNIHQNPPKAYEARYMLSLLDDTPTLNTLQQKFFKWVANYYMAYPGEVLNAALPSGLKISSESKIQLNPGIFTDKVSLTDQEQILISALKNNESISYSDAADILQVKNPHDIIKSLVQKELIIIFEEVREKYKPKIAGKIFLAEEYTEEKELENLINNLQKKPKQQDIVLKYLQEVPVLQAPENNQKGIFKKALLDKNLSASSLQTLIKKGIFREEKTIIPRFETNAYTGIPPDIPQLSSFQQEAYEQILQRFENKNTVLLHGITGSGKTHIYYHLIQEVLEQGFQVLYLLPEIALTTQIIVRLKKIFGNRVGIYHSKFSDNERVEVWNGIRNGDIRIVVGVRSSVFLPYDNLGLIIIDEEHEASFKQYEPAPRYHARDTALMLSRYHHCKTLLGTATPSVESYYLASCGKWGLVTMTHRYGQATLPEFELVNISREKKKKLMQEEFSSVLLQETGKCLEQGYQAIFFQNRRGFSYYISCHICGWIPMCENCDVSLTYHQINNQLRCHYCGYKEKTPSNCPHCGTPDIKTVGFGTEKIEDQLKIHFPNARIQRMDQDTTRNKYAYENIIQAFENHETDILVGTQMVSKGLDFEKVQLVGIFDVDRMLHFPDFRSQERTYNLITQISGRAGRKEIPGKVVIQTANPYQPILHKIINHEYINMYQEEINERKTYKYPPFTRLIKVTFKHKTRTVAEQGAEELSYKLRNILGDNRILGPAPPVIDKIRNHYHQDLLIKLERNKLDLDNTKKIIRQKINEVLAQHNLKKIRIAINVDPV